MGKDNNKKSVIKNYLYNSGYQVLALIVPLVTTPYVSRVLGADNIGIYEYIYSIGQYFVLFGCLGLNLYGQREIAYCRDDKEKRSKVFLELVILRIVTMGIAVVLYLILAQFSEYRIYFYYLIFTLLASVIDISWLYQGLEEFKITVLRNTIVKILGIIIIFAFVKDEGDLWIYFLSHSLTLFLGNGTLWLHLTRYVPVKIHKDLNLLGHLRGTVVLFVPQIAMSVYTILDKTMLGYFANTTQVGYYSQSEKIVKIAMTVVTAMGTVMLPRISRYFAEKDDKAIEESIYRSARFVFLTALPIIFGLVAIAETFVPWFYGSGYDPVKILLPALTPIVLFIGLSNVIGTQYLVPVKKQKEYTISIFCGAAVNAILNLCLIHFLQALGASIATVCSEFTVLAIQLFFVRKDFSIRKMFAPIWKYFLAAVVMLGCVKLVQSFLSTGTLSIIIQCCAGVVVYVLMLLILRDTFFKSQLNKVVLKIVKK